MTTKTTLTEDGKRDVSADCAHLTDVLNRQTFVIRDELRSLQTCITNLDRSVGSLNNGLALLIATVVGLER